MKRKSILSIFLVGALVSGILSACNGGNDPEPVPSTGVTSLSLNQTTASLKVDETVQLIATVEPATATVTWKSSNEKFAIVDDKGLVTGIASGRAVITATAGDKMATCIVEVGEVTVIDDNPGLKYLQGTDYYVFAMDATTFETIKDKVKDDFRINGAYEGATIPDATTSVLEIWNTDLSDANWPLVSGLNSFGVSGESWIAMNAASCSWGNMCGGLRQVHRTVDLSAINADYTLVILYKAPASNNAGQNATFTLFGTGNSSKVELVNSSNTAGEWVALEYSMADLYAKGLDWSTKVEIPALEPAFYTLGITIAGAGQQLEVDAAFVYKK